MSIPPEIELTLMQFELFIKLAAQINHEHLATILKMSDSDIGRVALKIQPSLEQHSVTVGMEMMKLTSFFLQELDGLVNEKLEEIAKAGTQPAT